MDFKKFLQAKIFFIFSYYLGAGLFSAVAILSATRKGFYPNFIDLLYGFFLSSLLLLLVLYTVYRRERKFLNIIEENLEEEKSLDYVFNIPQGINPEFDLIRQGLIKNYGQYINTIDAYKDREKLMKHFNSRWIHEMKTPVSVMRLLIDQEKDDPASQPSRARLESMEEEIEKLSNGLEMALYTLRVDDFNKDLKVEDVNLTELVRLVINENKKSFIMNKVYPRLEASQDVYVKTDRKWLKFVINQIVVNGIKYTKVKDIDKKEILISIREKKDVEIVIRDNGIGIKKSDIGRIFEPFYTGLTGRKYLESTGMGLYLSKIIIDKLGHTLMVRSEEGEFTEFSIGFKEVKNIYSIRD